jgi:hypothetical protein
MFYKLDKKDLLWKRDWRKLFVSLGIGILLILSSFMYGRYSNIESLTEYEKEIYVLNIQQEKSKFTKQKLIFELQRLKINFPHIVLAQSKLETGNWTSKVFKETNNLFGMKEPRSRITTANGTHLNHAYYNTWEESVYDYAFYSCRYMNKVKNEEEYFALLEASYAEDPNYISKLKEIIEKEKLRDLF